MLIFWGKMIFVRLLLLHTILSVQTSSYCVQISKRNFFLDYEKSFKQPRAVQPYQKMPKIVQSSPMAPNKRNICDLQLGRCISNTPSIGVGAPIVNILDILNPRAYTAAFEPHIHIRKANKLVGRDVWKNLFKPKF